MSWAVQWGCGDDWATLSEHPTKEAADLAAKFETGGYPDQACRVVELSCEHCPADGGGCSICRQAGAGPTTPTCLITIEGGVIQHVEADTPAGVRVIVHDLDDEEEGEIGYQHVAVAPADPHRLGIAQAEADHAREVEKASNT